MTGTVERLPDGRSLRRDAYGHLLGTTNAPASLTLACE
jgi:hypothetical protein